MRLDVMQKMIGKLYTNSHFLNLFTYCQEWLFDCEDLNEKEIKFLKSISIDKIKKINSIIKEEYLVILKNCFHTFSIHYTEIFKAFSKEFQDLSYNYPMNPDGKLRMCDDFYNYCLDTINGFHINSNSYPQYLDEIIAFDYLLYKSKLMNIPGVFLCLQTNASKELKTFLKPYFHDYILIQDSNWPIHRILEDLEKGSLRDFHKESTSILFIPTQTNTAKTLLISRNTRSLIPLFNGNYSIGELYKMFNGAHEVKQINESLNFLISNQVLTLL